MVKRKGFSLFELLVVIAIISILSGFGIYWFLNYKFAREVEDRTYKIYALLKKYQLLAKARKEKFCFEPSKDSFKLIVKKECSNTVEELTTTPFKLAAKFSKGKKMYVNPFGVFSPSGRIWLKESKDNNDIDCANQYTNIAYCCVAISTTRVCLGKYDGSKCNCSY